LNVSDGDKVEEIDFPGAVIVAENSTTEHEWIPISITMTKLGCVSGLSTDEHGRDIRPQLRRLWEGDAVPGESESVYYCDTDKPSEETEDLCKIDPFSSAMCSLGTKGCDVRHGWIVGTFR
jgi:hypothetical protein